MNTLKLEFQHIELETTTRKLLRWLKELGCKLRLRRNTPLKPETPRWTRTHGFFLQMGGFMSREEGKQDRVLRWEALREYYKEGRLDLSDITEDRINDHSKADGFAKGLALLQMFWFITQCVARFFDKNLILTEIELVTAALALLSFAMYLLWWNKPFNAGVPITITLLPAVHSVSGSQPADRSPRSPTIESDKSSDTVQWRVLYLRTSEMMWGKNSTDSAVTSVPSFYSVSVDSDAACLQIGLTSFSAAALFGSIHCIGWSSKIIFTSHATSLVWRITSAVITASPVVWCLLLIFVYAEDASAYGSALRRMFEFLIDLCFYASGATIPMYIAARLALLVLAFVELQHVSPGALANIHWVNVLPFIH
ncbi:hypothetical protein CPC08DRAFT_801537 [Agrocybe pediades]|nr:hypothetical protein CPC08DRAFT_801537 [Agrocybe pediades]